MTTAQLQTLDFVLGGRAGPLQHFFKLIDGGSPSKERLSSEHLSQHTTHAPDINSFGVLSGSQQDLRGPVPSGSDVLGEDILVVVLLVLDGSHQSEVAQLGLAVFVDEYVRRFDVAVNEAGRVDVEEGFGHLVEDVLAVPFCQDVLADERVQIDVHVLENQVDVPVVLGADDLL